MIINIPTSTDFYQSGKELFNFAWDAVSNLLTEFDQASYYGLDDKEVSEKYWTAARRTLSTSLTIVQQGIEIILKGKIAEISPYLLISDPPTRWPSPYDGSAIDFSQFRTVDSQDLIRIHDTFAAARLTTEFSERFNLLRERRNIIMHTASNHVSVHVLEVIESILYVHKALFPRENWASTRREFLRNSPDSEFGSGEYATNRTCWEFSIVKRMLAPAQVLQFMGINKKQRAYLCPACLDDANTDAGFEFKLAVLRSKDPTATKLYCPVCNQEHDVQRSDCQQDACPGNVISNFESTVDSCLTCGEYWHEN